MSIIRPTIALDLGTSKLRIARDGGTVVFNEPSVVAIDERARRILAFGEDALQFRGYSDGSKIKVFPIVERGKVCDMDLAAHFLEYALTKSLGRFQLLKPDIIATIPLVAESSTRSSLLDALSRAGARRIILVREPVCAALGAGCSAADPRGRLVIDLGAGLSSISVISLGSVVSSEVLSHCGTSYDKLIREYIRKIHHADISLASAQEIKHVYASALNKEGGQRITIPVVDRVSGKPDEISLLKRDIVSAVSPAIAEIVATVQRVLASIGPEASSDIVDAGIILSGGGADLKDLPARLSAELGISARVASEPFHSAVRGASGLLEKFSSLHASSLYLSS